MTRPESQDLEVSELLARLRGDLAEDPGLFPEADFSAQLHRRLVAAGPPAPVGLWPRLSAWLGDRPWVTGTLCGVASGVAAFALMNALSGAPSPGATALATAGGAAGSAQAVAPADTAAEPPEPALAAAATPPVDDRAAADCEPPAEARAEVFVVPAGQVAMVQLNFAVERGVDEAEFSILLPDGLAFFSEGEALPERAFHWVAPLQAGDNEVPVAIIGRHAGVHRLTATATIDGEVVVHEVVLEVREAV